MVVVAASPDEDYSQKSPSKGSAHSLQHRAPPTNNHERSREAFLEFILVNVPMPYLVMRLLCPFAIGKRDFHCVLTCLDN